LKSQSMALDTKVDLVREFRGLASAFQGL